MARCIKELLGGSESISNKNFKALSFKRSDVRNFIKANTDLYGTSIKVKNNEGS